VSIATKNQPAVFPASDYDFHVVVQTYRCHTAKMLEGGDVLTGSGLYLLSSRQSLAAVEILTKRTPQRITPRPPSITTPDSMIRGLLLSFK